MGKQLKESDIMIKTSTLTVDQLKKDRDITVEREASSHAQWEKMDDETRQAIKDIVTHMLETVLDQIDTWLPASLDMNEVGQYADVTFRAIFADLKTQIETNREMTSRQLKQAREETLAMAQGDI